MDLSLQQYVDTLNVLSDESRLRLCALLRGRELCVSDLVKVTGLAQSRVSTHLGRLKDAGYVHDRKSGALSFYSLNRESLSDAARTLLDLACRSSDATLEGDRERLEELDAERKKGLPEAAADDLERFYSPGRSWQSLTAGLAALLDLGDVLDVGSGDGSAALALAPYCRSLTCVDRDARLVENASQRLSKFEHVQVRIADVHALPFDAESFDAVLLFHTLTYAEHPSRALSECARVLRAGGRLVVLCLEPHSHEDFTARYGEVHPGFASRSLRAMLSRAALEVASIDIVSREPRRPDLRVLRAVARKAHSSRKKRT